MREFRDSLFSLKIIALFVIAIVGWAVINGQRLGEQRDKRVIDGPPIFLIVFDEFSTEALLDTDMEVDSRLFPNFAKLKSGSYWFKDGTSIAAETQFAVPAIMTGQNPPLEDFKMAYEHYPNNICTILWRAGYTINAYESSSTLCQRAKGAKISNVPQVVARVAEFIKSYIPNEDSNRENEWRQWVEGLRTDYNSFNFIHIRMPHSPYEFMPDGYQYNQNNIIDLKYGDINEVWQDEALAAAVYQQYVWQVQYVDKLLGLFFDKLKEEGKYDEALLVVTADHGVTYRMGANRRWPVMDENGNVADKMALMDLIKIPLFIKLPNQSTGTTVDSPAMNIDILPTIIDYLGIKVEGEFAGRNLLANDLSDDYVYKLYGRSHYDRVTLRAIEHFFRIGEDGYSGQE